MNKPDTTTPGIDKQGQGFKENAAHDMNKLHESEMKDAVSKDRAFKDSEKNPGKDINQNDQAYSQSSEKDFVKTHSKFHHSDEDVNDLDLEKI